MLEQIVNFTNFVIALAALVIAAYNWVTASRAARNDILAQVRDWAGDVVDTLADARALCEFNADKLNSTEFVIQRTNLRFRISALLDRGRFFFPNLEGIRPPILDLLMIAYELIPRLSEKSADNRRRGKALDYLQSVFVSTVRQAVDFSRSPASVGRYEEYLANIQTQPLPQEILEMMENNHNFQIVFDERSLDTLPKRDPAPTT